MAGEIDIAVLVHMPGIGFRQRQFHHQRLAMAAFGLQHGAHLGDAVIVIALEGEFGGQLFGARRLGGQRDGGRRIHHRLDVPFADGMAAHLHPHPRIAGQDHIAGIFAVLAGKARRGIAARRQARGARRAMHPQIQHRSLRHPDDGIVAHPQRGQRHAGIGRRIDPGVQGGGRARAAVKGLDQARAGIAARHTRPTATAIKQIPAQAMRIAAGNVGPRQCETEFAGQAARLVQRSTALGRKDPRPPARHRARKWGDGQSRCRVPAAAPRPGLRGQAKSAKPS